MMQILKNVKSNTDRISHFVEKFDGPFIAGANIIQSNDAGAKESFYTMCMITLLDESCQFLMGNENSHGSTSSSILPRNSSAWAGFSPLPIPTASRKQGTHKSVVVMFIHFAGKPGVLQTPGQEAILLFGLSTYFSNYH